MPFASRIAKYALLELSLIEFAAAPYGKLSPETPPPATGQYLTSYGVAIFRCVSIRRRVKASKNRAVRIKTAVGAGALLRKKLA